MAKFFVSSILGLASLQGAMAAPAPGVYPEVIPGAGLPSLAELSLTSAQLYEMEIPKELLARAEALEKRWDPQCGPSESAYTKVNDIIACYHYLNSLGNTACVAGENTVMCRAGQAQVIGSAINGGTSSYCRHVAEGVLWSVNSCTRADQSCAGSAAAHGNGYLIVSSRRG